MMQAIASDMVRPSLTTVLEIVGRRDNFTPEEARQLLGAFEVPIFLLERLDVLAKGFLDRGMEESQLVFLLKEFRDVTELGIKAFSAGRERVHTVNLPQEEKEAGIARLDRAKQRAEEIRDELSELLQWLSHPFNNIDPATLPAEQGEEKVKGFVRFDEVLKNRLLGK